MAEAPDAGKYGDAIIYDREFFGGMTEVLQQNADVFNAGSANTMNLVPRIQEGDFEKESFFPAIDGLVRDRDPDSNADVSSKKLSMDEMIRVNVAKGIGPVDQTRDFFLRLGETPELMSFALGQMVGQEVAQTYVNDGILSVATAMQGYGSGMVYDYTNDGGTTLDSVVPLISANAMLGDKAQRIAAYVMHSKVWHDLTAGYADTTITNVADVIIYGGVPGSLGRPVIVTDSPSLVIPGGSGVEDKYLTLGLTPAALEIAQTQAEYVAMQEVLGQENIVWRLQGEYQYLVGLKGFAFTGSAHPTEAELGSEANWDFRVTDVKSGPGVALITN